MLLHVLTSPQKTVLDAVALNLPVAHALHLKFASLVAASFSVPAAHAGFGSEWSLHTISLCLGVSWYLPAPQSAQLKSSCAVPATSFLPTPHSSPVFWALQLCLCDG